MFIDSMMWDVGLQDAADYGRKCERIGYDCVWTYEAAHNPFMPLAQVAAATETVHIGTNIAVAFARSPYAMAQAAWDLAEVSKGRFHLGVGSQVRAHVERRFSAEFDHPAARRDMRRSPSHRRREHRHNLRVRLPRRLTKRVRKVISGVVVQALVAKQPHERRDRGGSGRAKPVHRRPSWRLLFRHRTFAFVRLLFAPLDRFLLQCVAWARGLAAPARGHALRRPLAQARPPQLQVPPSPAAAACT